MRKTYYAQRLSAAKLQAVYALAGPRVQRYLQAEIDRLAAMVAPGDRVLELGCGYGRVLAAVGGRRVGVDLAWESLKLGRATHSEVAFALMDAARMGFGDQSFDLVFGVQNFISVCQVSPADVLTEALRVVRPNGRIVLASYTASFWSHRLDWFRRQAEAGLIGAIDEEASRDGVIVGRDGFRATRFGRADFARLAATAGCRYRVYAVDASSLFCEVVAPHPNAVSEARCATVKRRRNADDFEKTR